MSKIEFGKGTAFLSIEAIVNIFSGYIFWIVLSKFTTAEIIGTSSAVISLATILASIVTIGVPSGVQRFLGRSFFEQKAQDTKLFVKASLLIVSTGILCCCVIIFIIKDWMYHVLHIEASLFVVFIFLLGSLGLTGILRSVVIASLKTKILTTSSILTAVSRFALSIVLVIVGTGALGVTIGYTSVPVLTSVLLAATIWVTMFRSPKGKPDVSFIYSLKNILNASIVFWIPGLITTIGSQLGTVVVFGSQGAYQAGLYFIAFTIATGITLLASALSTIAYPTISAMRDGRKRLAWRITKLALVITFPLSSAIMFYSEQVMAIFGKGYIGGSSTLEILMLSILPGAVSGGIGVLVYAYGNNRQVLILGLAVSIPRTISYFILVPYLGSIGAATSYIVGSIVVLAIAVIIANKVGMRIIWKQLAIIAIIPTGFAFILSYIGINYIIGIIATLVASYLLFLRFRIITLDDLQDGSAILPTKIADPTFKILVKLIKRLDR